MKRNQNFDHNHSQKVFSCRYNMDINRVEARFEDGTILSIDCIVIEDEYGNTPAQRAELDWLLTAGVLPPFATFLKSVSIWDIPSTSRPESTSRTRKAIMSRRTNGRFSRIPMKLSLTSRPLTLCRKSVGMSDATRTAGAKQLPSQACFIVPIAAARCMSTAPITASAFLNTPAHSTQKFLAGHSARPSTVSMKMWYCPLSLKC